MIHTPTPATPLCTEGEISPQLVHESMSDPSRLYTVIKRPDIIRSYLASGGVLIAAYPESGRDKRTPEQLTIFESLKETYPKNLIDIPLQCDQMEGEMVGATYFFKTEEGEWMVFAIMACQANAPEDGRTWGMWLGNRHDPEVSDRFESVFTYLYEVSGSTCFQCPKNMLK